MKKWLFAGLLFIGFANFAFAQIKTSGSVTGKLVDTTGKQDLSQATVSVTPVADSLGAQFVVTNKQGVFLVRNLKMGNYRMIISFEGYQAVYKKFSLDTAAPAVDFGNINLQKASQEMA